MQVANMNSAGQLATHAYGNEAAATAHMAAAVASESGGPSCDSTSHASANTDQQCFTDALDPTQRTHHLLKHCLSQSQRGAALAQFHTTDPREAAKEIARMGQRELQAKFKDVYGSATKSNNNSWLRRKLYEAVGVAPLKANTKGKSRKAGGSAGGSRKSHAAKDGSSGSKASKSPKLAAIKTKRVHDVAAAPCASPSAQPMSGGPLSVLDLYQHSGLISNDTSDSEEGDLRSQGSFSRNKQSAPSTPHSPAAFSGSAILTMQQQAIAGTLPSCRPSDDAACALPAASAGFVPVAEPQSPMAGLHWADAVPVASPELPPAQLSPSSFMPTPGDAPATLFTTNLGSQTLPVLEAGLPSLASVLKPLELDQDTDVWEADAAHNPWYFGSKAEFVPLSAPIDAARTLPMPMNMDDSSMLAVGDDDDIPLLTLDLGAIDVSI